MSSLIEIVLKSILDGTSDIKLAPHILEDEKNLEQLRALIDNPDINLNELLPSAQTITADEQLRIELEAVVWVTGRPALLINNDSFIKTEDPEWKETLESAKTHIESAIKATGRIQYGDDLSRGYEGTGWLVTKDIVVTNRHVAEGFAKKNAKGKGFVFKKKNDDVTIDFKGEDNFEKSLFQVEEILHIEETKYPDIAFLRISRKEDNNDGVIRNPISLSESEPKNLTPTQNVATIGYASVDSRDANFQVINRIFNGKYNLKRLQPGKILDVTDKGIRHDASTLGGNSGSVLLDLETGQALGVHYGGIFREANYAVPASIIKKRLEDLNLF